MERGEGERGEVRWRTAGFSLFVGAEGRPVVKAEEWLVLMGMKWLALN
jgi:hypothetical protein